MTTSLAKMTSSKISTFFFSEADFCKRDTRMFNAKQLEDSTWCWRTPLNIDWLSQGSTYFLLTISRSSERGVKKLVTSSHSEMCLGSVIKSYTINTILRVSNITYKKIVVYFLEFYINFFIQNLLNLGDNSFRKRIIAFWPKYVFLSFPSQINLPSPIRTIFPRRENDNFLPS